MLKLVLLGEERLIFDGRDAVGGESRGVEILAYLVLHPGAHIARLMLAGIFWPDSTDAQALTNLRRELHHLRRLPGLGSCLETTDGAIAFLPHRGLESDVQDQLELAQSAREVDAELRPRLFLDRASLAVDAYAGELMPGNYAEWVLPLRQSLLESTTVLADLALEAALVVGEQGRALTLGRARVALQPLDEVGHRGLIRVHLARGDHGAAMQAFHHCVGILGRELGVGPAAETRDLLGSFLSSRSAASEHEPAQPSIHEQPLGRAHEMEVLGRYWELAQRGGRLMVVLNGPPGVGKSHLAAALASAVSSSGSLVATARCVAAAAPIPLAPVAAWLRSAPFGPLLAALPPELHDEVARLFTGGQPEGPGPGTAAAPVRRRAMVDAWQRFHFFDALAQTVGSGSRPTLLILDDLQWCDTDTLAWLAFALDSPDMGRFLLVASRRAVETGNPGPVEGLLAAVRGAGNLYELNIEPFGLETTAELASQIGGRTVDAEEERRLFAATGGYPLFILEAAHQPISPEREDSGEATSRSLDGVLGRRLRELGPEARHVAELVAAFGRECSLDLLSEATDLEANLLVEAIDELWRMGILLPVGGGYDFSHHLVRTAVYDRATPAGRWLLHRRLAQGLELLNPERQDAVASILAQQYELGSNPAKALDYHLRAGVSAVQVFANAAALQSYGNALALIAGLPAGRERDERELDVLRAMSPPQTALHGYSSPQLLHTLTRAVELSRDLGYPQILSASLMGLFAARFVQGRVALSHHIAEQALELAGDDADLVGQGHFAVAGTAMTLGRTTEAMEHFTACLQHAPQGFSFILGTQLEVHARAWASHAHWLGGDSETAQQLGAQALTLSASTSHPYSRAVALAYVGVLQQIQGKVLALGDTVAELVEICRRYDIAYYGQWGRILQGWLAGGDRGKQQMRSGISGLRRQGAVVRMPYWLSLLAEQLEEEGDRPAAVEVLEKALDAAEEQEEGWWTPELLRRLAGLVAPDRQAGLRQQAVDLVTAHGSVALLARWEPEPTDQRPEEGKPSTPNAGRTHASLGSSASKVLRTREHRQIPRSMS